MSAATFRPSVLAVCAALVLGLTAFAVDGRASSFETIFASYLQENRLIDTMRAELLAASEAEKSAVLAETDESSLAFAKEARLHSATLETSRLELVALVDRVGLAKEKELLTSFGAAWREYQQLDRQILELAVLNTNLKATRLLHGECLSLLSRLEESLAAGRDQSGAPETVRAKSLSDQILIDALKIQTLLAPHIQSPDDGVMNGLEKQIRALEQRIVKNLDELSAQASKPEIKNARAEAQRISRDYAQQTQQIIVFSRRNSNVISLSLSLGQKRKITARCMELLDALKSIASNKEFKATR